MIDGQRGFVPIDRHLTLRHHHPCVADHDGQTRVSREHIIGQAANVALHAQIGDEKIDLESSLSDLSSQVIVYQATQRNLQEQLAEAKNEIQKIRGGGAIASAGPRSSFNDVAGPMIRGRVEAVQTETATGDLIVQISLGSNDRIRQNSRLYLNRDGREYLGDLHIFEVDLNHAFGRVVNQQPGVNVRQGDQVWSKLSNG